MSLSTRVRVLKGKFGRSESEKSGRWCSGLLVLGRNTLKRDNEILEGSLLLVLLGRLAVHEVIEAGAALHEVVETTHDTEDTERENPDTDNSDNASLATNEPTEDTEEGGKDIDDQDSARQLPRGDGRPEGTVGTGDEDQPVLSKRDLEEENLIDLTEVLNDSAVLTVRQHGRKSDPGTDSQDNTEKNGHTPELGKIPLDRSLGEGSVVVGDSKGGNIGENGDKDDKLNVERSVEDGDPETKEDLHVQGKSDTVDNVGIHSVEDLTGRFQGVDDGSETGGKENDIRGGSGGIGGTLDSNTSIGLLQRGSIVDTITSHGNKVTTLLENLNDVVLVLGENLSETIGSLNEIVNLRTGHVTTTTKTKALSVVNVGTEAELTRSLTGNTDSVTSKHLDGETKALGFVDSSGSVVTRGVRAGHDSENLPSTLTSLASNTKRSEATGSKLSHTVFVRRIDFLRDGVVLLDGLENKKWGTLDTDDTLALRGLDNSLDLLGDGVKGVEVENLVLGQNTLGAGVELESLEESLVDGINTLLLAGSSQTSSEHQVIGLNASNTERLSERELVLGQSTSLVRAENLDTSKGLNGGKLLDDGLLLGKVGGTDGHGGSDDGGKTDRDTDDSNSKGETEDVNNAIGSHELIRIKKKRGLTNSVQNLSEVTSATSRLRDESSGTTNEGVVTSGSNDNEGLTTLDSGRSVTVVTMVLVDSERLSSDGGLINLAEAALGNETTISRNDRSLFDLEDVTGNDFRGLDLLESAITENNSLESKSFLELLDDGTSLVLLNETNTCVEKEKSANDTEINPVFKTSSKNSGSFLYEMANEEHEELENHVLLLFFHGVETPFLATCDNLSLSQTNTRVSLELVLGDDTSTAGGGLLVVVDLVAVLGLEVLDQGIHVLIGLLILGDGSLGVVGSGSLSSLLIEAASLDVGVERGCADRLLFGHGR
ncbi:unnamed protein product [Fusarium graminearum]|uniref:Uncharacterized protein n=1 Tax=Gibberella zeae TaxID=5518 RepID=A0A4E9EPS3_GIBZA|nr:unnamed protein product [Fusarium graminearum]CAF3597664.1 unnamed protein product [Fusarium graminearum]